MRLFKIWYAIVMLIALVPLLTACPGGFTKVHERAPQNTQEATTFAINEAQVAIASGYTTITQARTEKWITADEFKALRDELDKADEAYRKALDLYKLSDLAKAKSRAELAQSLTKLVTSQLAVLRNP